ncbi:MAG: amino acid ABC transporter ATP-binding protein [Parvibaculaceae bacterium]
MPGLVLEALGITKNFGAAAALNDVSFSVAEGGVTCIIGPSGCGKSTLLRCLSYLTLPDAGLVRLSGQWFGHVPQADGKTRIQPPGTINSMRPQIGFVFQQFNLWPHFTVLQNITHGPVKVRKMPPEHAAAEARLLLERFGLNHKANDYPSALSGGQKQRVAIARALAMDPKIVFFDEPTSALDPEAVKGFLAVAKELAGSGMSMVIVTHEMGFARNVADQVIFMESGKIIEQGAPQDILVSPSSPRLQAFLQQIYTPNGTMNAAIAR